MSLDELRGSNAAAAGLIRSDVVTGEPAGEGFRQAINAHLSAPSVYEEYLGDPTLRLAMVKPITGLNLGFQDYGNPMLPLTWYHSADHNLSGFEGYDVYRADSPDGSFTRLNANPITGTTYSDNTAEFDHEYTYMVRAVQLTTTSSGNYDNLSQGIFLNVVNQSAPPQGGAPPGGGDDDSESSGDDSESGDPLDL